MTFAIGEKTSDVSNRSTKRFAEDPILAYITRINSNLQPMYAPFLGYIYNNYDAPKQPAFSYSGGKAQRPITAAHIFKRRNVYEDEKEMIFHCDYEECPSKTHSCESTLEAVSENSIKLRITTQCMSITKEYLRTTIFSTNNHTAGMFYYETPDKTMNDEIKLSVSNLDYYYPHKDQSASNESEHNVNEAEYPEESEENILISKEMSRRNADAIDEEIIFHCVQLTCPSKTHSCKSTFIAVPEDFIEINVTTQCLSITNEVLEEKSTKYNNPLSDMYYFEFKAIDHENNDE